MARRLGVTRQDVVHAAVVVADRDGFDSLTVAGVAVELGCRPPSVHHHVAGLDGLRSAVAEVAAAELAGLVEDAVRDRHGRDALRAYADAYRGWARTRPARYAALVVSATAGVTELDEGTGTGPEPAATQARPLDAPRQALRIAGVHAADEDRWLAALVAAVHGVVAVEVAGGPGDHDAREAAAALLLGALLDALPAPG